MILPTTHCRLACLLMAILCLGVSRPATGQADQQLGQPTDTAKIAVAREAFEKGLELFNRANFDEACPYFETSLAVVPGVGTRGKLAECYEKLGLTASAWRLFKEVEVLSKKLGDERRAEIAAQRVQALEPLLARLTIDPGPSVSAPGFAVQHNTKPVAPRSLDRPIVVDPGTQVLVASAPGYQSWSGRVHIRQGQSVKATIPALTRANVDEPGQAPQFNKRSLGLVLFGVGAVSTLGGGTVYALRARSKWNEASPLCDEANLCTSRGHRIAGEARTNATIATVFVGAGMAAMAGGAFLWWRYRHDPKTSESNAFEVTPVATLEILGVSVNGRF